MKPENALVRALSFEAKHRKCYYLLLFLSISFPALIATATIKSQDGTNHG